MSIPKKQETHCPDGIRHQWHYEIVDDPEEGKKVWGKVCKRCGQYVEQKNAEVRFV